MDGFPSFLDDIFIRCRLDLEKVADGSEEVIKYSNGNGPRPQPVLPAPPALDLVAQ